MTALTRLFTAVAATTCAMFIVADRAAAASLPGSVLDEVVVTGERAGPGLWHVAWHSSQLWILGTVSPLPKDMTWRSQPIESLLDRTNQILVSKPIDIGVARALWLLITQRELLMVGGGRRLKDVLPADLHARFAKQRAKYTNDPDKWEKYRPAIAALFLQEAALHQVGLSTKLDIGNEVRDLARKHRVKVVEIKIAGVHDVLDVLKSLPPETEDKCVAAGLATVESGLPRLVSRAQAWATGDVERMQKLPEPPEVDLCRAAASIDAGSGDLLALVQRTWLANMEHYLRDGSGTTLAVVSMELLLRSGGLLDGLRAAGYTVDAP